jgi:hypothetical protein
MNGQYLEVVCPLDHPATDQTPWGKAVSRKADEGGGWFTWVFSTEDISPIEAKFGREAIEGHRTRPNGTQLKWKQIGVKEIADSREFPFFIQWLTTLHPSEDQKTDVAIEKIVIADKNELESSWFKVEILSATENVEIEWVSPEENDGQNGIVSVQFLTTNGPVVLE